MTHTKRRPTIFAVINAGMYERYRRQPPHRPARAKASWYLLLLLLLQLGGCATSIHAVRGDDAFLDGDLEIALAQYQLALKEEPDSKEIAAKIQTIRGLLVAKYTEQVRSALLEVDFLGALAAVRKAKHHLPDDPLIHPIITEAAQATLVHAKHLHQQKSYAEVLRLHEALAETAPSEAWKSRAFFDEVKREWSAILLERAASVESAFPPRKEEALLLYAKAAQLTGDATLRQRRDALRKEVLDTWKYMVHIHPESAPEIRLSIARYARGTPLHVVSSPDDKDATASFFLENVMIERKEGNGTRTTRYSTGETDMPNPDRVVFAYELALELMILAGLNQAVSDWEHKLRELTQPVQPTEDKKTPEKSEKPPSLSQAKAKLKTATSARDKQREKVEKIREKFEKEPKTNQIQEYGHATYPVKTETFFAEALLSLRIEHEDGRNPIIISEKLLSRRSDEAHDAVPQAGLPEDLLVLPPREVLFQEIHGQALVLAQTAIDKSFEQWRQELLIEARQAETEENRVESYVAYILTGLAQSKPEQQESIPTLLGILDAARVLRSER